MQTQLPYWLQVTQALGPSAVAVAVGLIATYIAFRQYKSAKDKLRLDLFEKRYGVYQEVRAVLATALQQGTITYDEVSLFHRKVRGAEFLFGSEIEALIEEARGKLNNLAYHDGQIRAFNEGRVRDDAAYQKNVDASRERKLEIEHLLMTESRRKFEAYLSFSHLK